MNSINLFCRQGAKVAKVAKVQLTTHLSFFASWRPWRLGGPLPFVTALMTELIANLEVA